jgi:hypothetical protein
LCLEFKEISDEFVHKQINKTNVKKATGRDGISAKLLKLAKPVIAKPITKMIKQSMIFLVKWLPLLVINGLIVGQKSFDLEPPIHLSKK